MVSCVPAGGGGGGEEPTTTTTEATTTTTEAPTTTTTTIPEPLHDVIEPCAAGEACEAEAQGEESTILVETQPGDEGVITIDVNEPGDLDCSGILPPPFYIPVNDDVFTVDSTTNSVKSITITTPGGKAALDAVPFGGAWSLGVCFASPEPFTSLRSTPPFFGPAQSVSGQYVGLLAPCTPATWPFAGFTAPCVSARSVTGNDTQVTAQLPAGDPRMK